MTTEKKLINVFVVSDFTGETVEAVARAASSQFNPESVNIRRFRYVNNIDKAQMIMNEAVENQAIVICTLVDTSVRHWLIENANAVDIDVIDIFGPLLNVLSGILNKKPLEKPGLSHVMDEEYFKRVKAVEFTINCDDGSNTNLLPEADIVLIGVSRTCKTPLSMYLAHKGLKTANIPLIPSLAPPEELFKIDSYRIIGLTIDAENLVDIRVKRLSMLGLDPGESDYTEKSKVYDELQYAQTIMSSLGVRVFNVTDRALEETAQEILAYFRR